MDGGGGLARTSGAPCNNEEASQKDDYAIYHLVHNSPQNPIIKERWAPPAVRLVDRCDVGDIAPFAAGHEHLGRRGKFGYLLPDSGLLHNLVLAPSNTAASGY
jgi:hypothetical protein